MNYIIMLGADISQSLNKGIEDMMKIINPIFIALTGLFALFFVIKIIIAAVKRTKPEQLEEANQSLKNNGIALLIVVLVASVGFTLINTVLKNTIGDGFDVTAMLPMMQWVA